jgi:hypothetical protein
MATLTNATITFRTNDNDKDDNTHVIVTIHDAANQVAARISSDFEHFDNNSTHGPFGLTIENPSTFENLQTGSVAIHIDPVGHDTWKFNAYVDLYFSDGQHLSGEFGNQQLTQDNRDTSVGISGFRLVPAAAGAGGGKP